MLNIVYLVIYLIISFNLHSQSVFQRQNPSYPSESLNSFIMFLETGWAIGNYGLILKTSNSGLTFQTQLSPSKANLLGISIVNSEICYIFDDSSRIFKSTNGGLNWFMNSSFSTKLNSLCFVNLDKGFAALSNGIGISQNGGYNWTLVNPDNSASYIYYSVFFHNENTGYISAKNIVSDYAYVFKTTNNGNNWIWFNTGVDAFKIHDFYFINSMTGWCTGSRFGKLYTMKTNNGGINWTETNTPAISAIPNNIYFSDSNNGYITTNNKIFKSINGGNEWFVLKEIADLNSSYFKNIDEYFIVDMHSRVLKTSNGGIDFDTLMGNNNHTLNRIQSISSEVLWCNGTNYSNWKSTNGGLNWIFDNYSASLNIRFSEFNDINTGFAISERGNVLKTTNFGINWNKVLNFSGEIFSLYFLNTYTGWAFTGDSIFMTTNGGYNWEKNSNVNSIIRADFINVQTGYGSNGNQLFKTTNSGFNWSLSYPGIAIDYYFINSQTGWIISDGDSVSFIMKTSDGGVNWNLMANVFEDVNWIRFPDVNTGYLLSYNKLFRTTDSGRNWKFVSIPTTLRVFDFDFSNAYEGWICGDNSLIIKLVNGGSIPINNETEIAYDIGLSQNYPNPFNAETNFVLTLSKNEFVSLKVYDMQGREIEKLIYGYLSAGKHNVKYFAKDLSSGVYYCVLKTSNRTISRKFVVLK